MKVLNAQRVWWGLSIALGGKWVEHVVHTPQPLGQRGRGAWRCTRGPPAVSLPSRCSRNHAYLHRNNVMSGSKHIPSAWLNKCACTGYQHLFLSLPLLCSVCLSVLLSLPSYCCCLPLSPTLSLCLSLVLFELKTPDWNANNMYFSGRYEWLLI